MIRDPSTGTFTSATPRPPSSDELREQIADVESRRTELETAARDKFLDVVRTGSLDVIRPITAELSAIADRIAELNAALPETEKAEAERIARLQRREVVARVRAISAHRGRLAAGARDTRLALTSLTVAWPKIKDALAALAAVLDDASGFEIDEAAEIAFAEAVKADIAAALTGAPTNELAALADATVEAAIVAAREMLRNAPSGGEDGEAATTATDDDNAAVAHLEPTMEALTNEHA